MADGRLNFDTKIDATGFQKGLGALKTMTGGAMKTFGTAIGNGVNTVKNFHKVGAVALTGLGGLALKMGADFDTAMSEVAAISGATGDELEALRAKAKEMGIITQFSASDSAEALKYMAMAGWDAQKMLDGLPGVMNLAAASGEELGLVSDIVTDAMTAFGIEASKATDFADLLATTSSSANTNVAMLGESFKYVAPVAGSLGYASEDVALALGLMANAGIKGGQAGTSLRASLTKMVKPTDEAGTMMKKLGISMTDSAGEMIPLETLLGNLRAKFADLSEAEQAQAATSIFGQEAMAGMLAIINASPEDFNKLAKSIDNSTGSAEKMAKTMIDNLGGDITMLKSSLEGLGLAFYEGVDNPARDVAQAFIGYTNSLSEAMVGPSTKMDEFMAKTGMTAEESGVVIEESKTQMERVAGTFGEILADMATKVTESAPEIISAVFEMMGAFVEEIKKVDLASVAVEVLTQFYLGALEYAGTFAGLGLKVVAGIIEGMAENMPTLITQAQETIATIITAITENLPTILQGGADILLSLVNGIAESMPMLIEAGMGILNQLIESFVINLPLILEAGMNVLQALVDGIVLNLPLIIPAVIEMVLAIIDALVENLPLLLNMGIQVLTALVEGIVTNLPLLIPAILQMVSAISDSLIENIPLLVELGIELVLGLIDGLIQALPWIITEAPRIINAFADAIYAALPQILALGIKVIIELGKGIIQSIPLIIQNAGAIFKAILNVFTLSNIFSLGKNLITSLKDGIQNMVPNLMKAGKDLYDDVINKGVEIFKGGLQMGKDLIQKIISGIAEIVPRLITDAKGLADDAIGAIANVFKSAPEKGRELISGLMDGVRSLISHLPNLLKNIANSAINAIKGAFSGAWQIGKDLIVGMWNGISSVTQWIKDKISGFAGNILGGIKKFFGIGSPSKVMAKEIGRWIPPGITVGWEAEMPDLLKTADNEMDSLKQRMKSNLNADVKANVTGVGVLPETQFDYVIKDGNKTMAMAGEVEVKTYLDSKVIGHGSARFVAEEHSLNRKRRA